MLVDGLGRKGENQLIGLTDTMKRAVFDSTTFSAQKGDFVVCEVTDAS